MFLDFQFYPWRKFLSSYCLGAFHGNDGSVCLSVQFLIAVSIHGDFVQTEAHLGVSELLKWKDVVNT